MFCSKKKARITDQISLYTGEFMGILFSVHLFFLNLLSEDGSNALKMQSESDIEQRKKHAGNMQNAHFKVFRETDDSPNSIFRAFWTELLEIGINL